MLRPADREQAKKLESELIEFHSKKHRLLGIEGDLPRAVLVEQIVESIRRIKFVHFIRDEQFDADRANPNSSIFDPLRAAVFYMRLGQLDEAWWLVFLAVHFGKHIKDGWRLVRDVYGSLGGQPWTWERISSDVGGFRQWLTVNEKRLKADGISRRFSNHRKYESLSGNSPLGTGAAVESYVNWISPHTHFDLVREAHRQVGQNPKVVFNFLYDQMNYVKRFGRLAKFDFLAMLGKLGLAPIEPGSAYLVGATGPLRGARLLFGADVSKEISASVLNDRLLQLDEQLGVGMQVLEDSLCNWQKSPTKFISFRG